jgi:hypothetical protein
MGCGGGRTRAVQFVRATEWVAANCHPSLMRVFQVFKLIFSPDLCTVQLTYSRYLKQETERASKGRLISTNFNETSKFHRNVGKSVPQYAA